MGSEDDRQRSYPYLAAAPVVGYRSDIFGAAGLERTYDAQLTGLVSLRPGDELLRKFRDQPYNPSDLYTSLDIDLQQAAFDLLGDQRGAVVAIEPTTGRVLALASNPTFNPNRVVDPDDGRDYVAALREREDSPLLNRATQGLYVPGSVFKIVTAVAGLGSGAIGPDTTYENQPEEYDTGFLVDGFRMRDFPTRRPDRPSARLLRGDRGLEQHLVRPRRARHRPRQHGRVGEPLRVRRSDPVRAAHVAQPGQRRRRPAGRFPRPGRAGQRRLRASGGSRHATPDGARGVDHRQRRADDEAEAGRRAARERWDGHAARCRRAGRR